MTDPRNVTPAGHLAERLRERLQVWPVRAAKLSASELEEAIHMIDALDARIRELEADAAHQAKAVERVCRMMSSGWMTDGYTKLSGEYADACGIMATSVRVAMASMPESKP